MKDIKTKLTVIFAIVVIIFGIVIVNEFLPMNYKNGSMLSNVLDPTYKTASYIEIQSSGLSSDNNSIWVKCKGHNHRSKVVVNNIICSSIVYNDHITAVLPNQTNNDGVLHIQILNKMERRVSTAYKISTDKLSRNIFVTGSGFGGDKNEAIWVGCKGHTNNTRISINGVEISTLYYEDHLTALLPTEYVDADYVEVKLIDSSLNFESEIFRIDNVKKN